MTQTVFLLFSVVHIVPPFYKYNLYMLIFQVGIDLKYSEVRKINLVQSGMLMK